MTVKISADGLLDVQEYFERMPEVTTMAARMAVNDVAERGALKMARDEMMQEVAFPAKYLDNSRLGVTKKARNNDLEAIITGRKRATSLARFAPGQTPASTAKRGVSVTVQRGRTVTIREGWLVRLKRGASLTEDQYNLGLAVRIRPGEKITGKHTSHQSWLVRGSVALLYGPSVDQVFRDVKEDISLPVLDMVATEFLRQFTRLTNG
ncbi:hypothetical protein MA12_gp35 [Pectobacterium phage MA12]|uniref:Neck protein n=1 Tax=Pectobacterium phage MA12 TaxID=2686474 RepID=A0A6B9RI20_9CAUD|nr:hypothetical protein JT356_gp20 [Pectobacterium phage MA11]YP_010000257.1 hypothetical protein JT357_gp35 [Pectobacterium phage MA12]QGF21044.1 hypothetical protein MA11_gp20 [Pectobacterium phage MA11]QHI00862.1 hypothetical protein MA12_gp35 [Pectobacterium phage MA12]